MGRVTCTISSNSYKMRALGVTTLAACRMAWEAQGFTLMRMMAFASSCERG